MLCHTLWQMETIWCFWCSLVSQSGLDHRQEAAGQRALPAVVSASRASWVDVGAWGSEMLALWPWQFSAPRVWWARHSLSGSDWEVPTRP